MFKFKNPLILVVITVIALLLFNACDMKKGSKDVNLPPVINITDYFGVNSIDDVGEAEIFQQTINWSAYDPDGIVAGFSFRVLNQDGVPIPTPGYEVLDEGGWVKHYLPGANQYVPLEQSEETTIWLSKQGLAAQSSELYTTQITINFPAADENGDSITVISEFQVRAVDNSDGISNTASKFFNGFSDVPATTVQSSKGIINGETIGLGVIFEFNIPNDPNTNSASTEAYYYKYKFEKRDLDGNVIPESEGGYPEYADGDWPDTYGQVPNNLVLITTETPITLSTNTWDDSPTPVPQDSTFLLVRGINVAGIETETTVISFLVSDQFTPGTIVYYGQNEGQKNDVYALGENHFATYLDESMSVTVASIETSAGILNATSMWVNAEEEYQVIGSEDLKVYMHWGWHGEFEENNPFKKMADETLDEATNSSYFAEIIAFDLRLDGEPLYYPPLPAVGDFLKVDDDGTEWLRVPIYFPISQRITLNATSLGGFYSDGFFGEHVFEARAVDLQGVVDPTPHTFSFHVYEPVPKEDKSGILIIDEEGHNPAFSPEPFIEEFYNAIVSNYDSEPGYINLIELKTTISNVLNLFDLHYKKSVLSPAEIQSYKTIIFHSDNPVNETSFWKEYESFKIYLSQGGNLIVSGGSNLNTLQNKLRANGFPILEDYFGIPLLEEDAILKASENWNANPYFINAVAQNGNLNDIALELPSSFNNLLNIYGGLGPIGYFEGEDELLLADIIYRYGCKAVDSETFPPTQEQFDEFNNLPVGLKYSNNDGYNICAIFSFPLSYMNQQNAADAMSGLLQEMGH
jgi:hypothetical protein